MEELSILYVAALLLGTYKVGALGFRALFALKDLNPHLLHECCNHHARSEL